MLVREQKVAMRLVGLTAAPSGRPARESGRHRAKAPARPEPAYAGGH